MGSLENKEIIMSLLRRRSVFAAKTEGTIGTAESLTGSEGVYNARDFSITPNIPIDRREGQGGFNYAKGVPGAMQGTCTIVHDLQYDGTNIPTWASVLLPACGYVATGGVFSPVSRGPGGDGLPKTLTLGHYHDGKLKRLSGAMGNAVFTFPTGQAAYVTFTFTGKYFEDETDAALITPTYPTAPSLRFADGGITWNSVGLCTASAAVDLGNSVIMRECAESGNRTGYKSALITNRAPVITADPEAVLVATQNRELQWTSAATAALAITIKSVGDSTLVFSAPAAQIENKQPGNRNDMITDDITWLATKGSSPDTELIITFTADS
jgi:hypothetical protein